jgi:hypothetical protein
MHPEEPAPVPRSAARGQVWVESDRNVSCSTVNGSDVSGADPPGRLVGDGERGHRPTSSRTTVVVG